MATSSTVASFKEQLVTSLEAAINDSTVQVTYGRPQDSLVRREGVFVADVNYSAEIANIASGRAQYDEDYTVDVVFVVARSYGEASDAEGRAFELFEYLRDLVADASGKTGLAVDGVWSVTLESTDAAVTHEGEGPVAGMVSTLRVRARVV